MDILVVLKYDILCVRVMSVCGTITIMLSIFLEGFHTYVIYVIKNDLFKLSVRILSWDSHPFDESNFTLPPEYRVLFYLIWIRWSFTIHLSSNYVVIYDPVFELNLLCIIHSHTLYMYILYFIYFGHNPKKSFCHFSYKYIFFSIYSP